MKLLLLLLGLIALEASAQVGINTTEPTATFDVNGTARIRETILSERTTTATDSILAFDGSGNLVRITSRNVVKSHLKSFVKGGFVSTSNQSLGLVSGKVKIPFDFEEFDSNNEYNTATATFTATTAGYYSASVQIKAIALLSVATNFGVAIAKNDVVVARCGFGNLSLLGITVTPPIRQTNTLVYLEAGDRITFQIYSDLLNVGILGTREDSFFLIAQEQ